MASYRGGRGKLDDMYLFDLQKSQGMKSVLSNLFSGARGDNNSDRPDTASASSVNTEEDAKNDIDDAKSELSEEKSAKGNDDNHMEERDDKSGHEASQADHMSVVDSIADSKSVHSKKKNMYVYDSDSEEEIEKGEEGAQEGEGNMVYMDEDGGMMVQKKTSTVQLEIKEPQFDLEDSHSIGEDSSQSDWNHLTAAATKGAQPKDIVPYVSLTCMPRLLHASKVSVYPC
ncbi:hypothetical protein EON65_22330 [archaeon]|nr:MAG: hypothetical protein EON65_22330 [archaeon]